MAVEAPVCLHFRTQATGLATLSNWDSLLLKTGLGHPPTQDDIALPVRWERAFSQGFEKGSPQGFERLTNATGQDF